MPGKLIFKPNFVQRGSGPHLDPLVYLTDDNENAFHSEIALTKEGVVISDTEGKQKFSLHVRWNIEGFGYIYCFADNGGEFYQLPSSGEKTLNLNYELAVSRVKFNQKRLKKFMEDDWSPSKEVGALKDLSEELLNDAAHVKNNTEKCSLLSQLSLKYSMLVGDYLELERARYDVHKNGRRKDFFFGCDARGYFQMDSNLFIEKFKKLFNFATITHYLKGDFVDFEAEEGKKQYAVREEILKSLRENNITIEGRPLFWTHEWVTPDWLKQKKYPELLKWIEKHVTQVVSHYKDQIEVWEVVNELHDWANELLLSREQTIEVTKLACEVARNTNPKIKLLINNCCPFGEYVQLKKMGNLNARFPQRTPHQFIQDLVGNDVDFDVVGVQLYFVWRSAADAINNTERYLQFGKEVHLSEVGAPSFGLKLEFIDPDPGDYSKYPYEWHRHWDEELQADWLEYNFTHAYSKPQITAANWYDFVDPKAFLIKGGLLRSPEGEEKAAVDRLLSLKEKWNKLP
ncbi:MAG: endo-1,4-beta-xylanase [Ignavibacteria bacterium]|nr:endo-1,4-beta-xylanase [Ignavibacteria bacterium]